MELLKYTFKRGLLYLPITLVLLFFTTGMIFEHPLLMPYPYQGFIERTEVAACLLCVPYCSFLLPEKFEIELSLVCGVRTDKLFFTKLIPAATFTVLPLAVFLARYSYTPYEGEIIPGVLPFSVPENYKLYALFSMFVTLFFFFALFSFLRVVSRNCYIPLILTLFANTYFTDVNEDIRKTSLSVSRALTDPFISDYLIGEVPEGCAAAEVLNANVWIHNRLLFLGLAVLLTVLTCVILRREKLHLGLGD